MLILIIVLLLVFGAGGGYYGHTRWGAGGSLVRPPTRPVRRSFRAQRGMLVIAKRH